jgi:branched-chain amino acid transport system permease protein
VVGVPAFRSRGRLAFAGVSLLWMVVAASLFWGPRSSWFTGHAIVLRRPDWMNALSSRPAVSYYFMALLTAAAVVWFATNLRRSRVGRALAAGRDGDAGVRSLGIDPAHYRLVALAFSAVVAALGGIVGAYGGHPLDPAHFGVFLSLQYFLYTVIGGSGSLAGAAVVVFAFEVAPALHGGAPPAGPGSVLLAGALAAFTVAFLPGGLAGLVRAAAVRLAPAPAPAPTPAPVGAGSSGFIDAAGELGMFDDDPYAAGDPFADDDLFGDGGLFGEGIDVDPFGDGGADGGGHDG